MRAFHFLTGVPELKEHLTYVFSCKRVEFRETLGCREITVYSHPWSPSFNFFTFADVGREHLNANFCIFEALFLGLCPSSNELFFSYLWSFIRKFISSDEI